MSKPTSKQIANWQSVITAYCQKNSITEIDIILISAICSITDDDAARLFRKLQERPYCWTIVSENKPGSLLVPVQQSDKSLVKWKPATLIELRRKRDSLVNMLLTKALEEPEFDVRPYTPLLAAVPPLPADKTDKKDRDVLSNLSVEDIQRIAAILIAAKEKKDAGTTK